MSETNVVPMAQSTNIVQVSQAGALLQAITSAASNQAVDIEKMERLFAMHQAMVKQEAETAFNAAMARAQAQMVPVVRDRANDFTKSTYATLAAINDAIAPIYTAEGFSISFDSADSALKDHIRTIAYVSHSAGHTRTHHNDMPLDSAGSGGKVNKTAIQASGSTQSYARRYLVCQIFNVTTEDDNDGNKRRERNTPTAGAENYVSAERQKEIVEIAQIVRDFIQAGQIADALVESDNYEFEAEERIFFHNQFDSGERSALKKEAKRQKDAKTAVAMAAAVERTKSAVITDGQRKRLEAMISERGIPRETIKKMCLDDHGVEHFKDLTQKQYDLVCSEIEQSSAAPIPPLSSTPVGDEAATAGHLAELPEVYRKIQQALEFASESIKDRFKTKIMSRPVESLPPAKADYAYAWLQSEIDKEAAK